MNRFVVAAVAAAGFAIAGSASAAVNLIGNGSFENGFTGWTLDSTGSGNPGYSPTVIILTDDIARGYPDGAFGEKIPADNAVSPDPDAVGTHAAYFSSDTCCEILSTSIDVPAGKYEVGFDAYIPYNGYDNPYDASFTAEVGGYVWDTVQLKQGAGAPGIWVHYFGDVIVGGGGGPTTFTFAADGYPAVDVAIDRVYAIAVPEPASWALMILGFGGAGAALRQRRRRAVAA